MDYGKADDGGSQLEFAQPTINLGKFKYEDTRATEAVVRFYVKSPVTILNVGKSCACVDTSELEALIGSVLEPKEYSYILPITLDNQAGLMHRKVAIECAKRKSGHRSTRVGNHRGICDPI